MRPVGSIRNLRNRFYRKSGGGRMIGRRCKDYFAGCIVCDFYRFLDERGRFPYTFDEGGDFSDQKKREAYEEELAENLVLEIRTISECHPYVVPIKR